MNPSLIIRALTLGLVLIGAAIPARRDDAGTEIHVLRTPSGVRFGVLGAKRPAPAPVLFVFATSLEDSLANKDYVECGRILAKQGFLCVSVDVPCHGQDRKSNEPDGLDGWRSRFEKGDDPVREFTARCSAVLDYLIENGYADPHRVAASGTSRGGFIALHFAAADARVKCTAAFAPVTDLRVLREFTGLNEHAATKAAALSNHADKLAGRSVWVCIGNNDERVGTDEVIAFTRRVLAASLAKGKAAPIELHVMPSAGHRIHPTAHAEAAAWIAATMTDAKPRTDEVRAIGDRLLNYSTSAAGNVRVELLTAAGQPIPGFSFDEALAFYGDSIAEEYHWNSNGELSEWAGKPVRVRFRLKDADIYSMQFTH